MEGASVSVTPPRIHIERMTYRDVVTVVAVLAIVPVAAVPYFYLFWTRIEFWRRHPIGAFAMIAGFLVGVGTAAIAWRAPLVSVGVEPPIAMAVCGWIVIVAASVFGTVADRQIGWYVRTFMPFFAERAKIDLKTSGAYGVVRHPIYASGIWFQIGAVLVSGSLAVAVACVVFALGARWFTRREERELVTLLRDPSEYERYRERVPALFPRLR
jgi:protein-S-isoprenylcysteine O-methyltransferase Ste14